MYPFPSDFDVQMRKMLGEDYTTFSEAYALQTTTSLRLNKTKAKQLPTLPGVPWATSGYYLTERPSFTLDPLFHAGAYYVQEASSMFLEQAFRQHVPLEDSLMVLDMCAAPGGKSTHILSLLNDKSLLVANEVIKSRAHVLKENCQKWGKSNVVIAQSDPERFSVIANFFDVVVVDAPCSGEGLFRKDPEAMKEWSLENIQLCSSRQTRILEHAWATLKPGGILIYSTCTFNEIEDEEAVDFILSHEGASSLPLSLEVDWGIQEVTSSKGGVGYKFFPHRVQGEGFFLALFKKAGERQVASFSKRSKNPFVYLSRETELFLSDWLRPENSLKTLLFGDFILGLPSLWVNEIVYLSSHLHLVSAGLEMAEMKKRNLIPNPALALSIELNKENFPSVDVNFKQALLYLAKEPVELDLPEGDWMLVTYKKIPLGWLKKIGLRYNNYYPTEWRIRMNVSSVEEPLPYFLK